MDPSALIPVSDTIPTEWGWFYFFLLLTFIMHLLLMNSMLGMGIMALVKHIKSGDKHCPVCKDISLKLPYTIAFTINFGVAPFLFLQVLYSQFIYTSSVLMGMYWLPVIALLLIFYYSAYIYDFKYDTLSRLKLLFLAVTVIFGLIIAFLFTNNMTLMLNPEKWTGYFENRSGTMLNLGDPTLIPRYLHFVLASIAVGGLATAIIWRFKKDPRATEYIREGLSWFSYATLVQVAVGVWFLISLPTDIMLLFMGGSALHTAIFLVALAGAGFSLFFGFKEMLWPTTAALLGTVVFMVLVRDLVRQAYLAPYFHPRDLEVVPQYSPLYFFIVFLVLGLAVVFYMLKLAFEAKREA
ncbi:hypothetical protein [Desulfonatronospira sp. MSAO_Bac3]|uniref:hypothetical protein n=1 Tax=Desulfonatronospira sp. MSAO_Bac3 TaxID=2293857 RepID=UPI000FF72B19|nr:hypothetical protein [Desulfonatronospira sp. MSAO_Bac3]RQD75168.1 MAG: hypothetical protein D5S03_08810 [Desulfonatronospira sp. MSAO_Bac3]